MLSRLLLITGLITLCIIAWPIIFSTKQTTQFQLSTNSLEQDESEIKPIYISQFASHQSTPEVHSATAIALDNNDILAFWYGGTREGHKDVAIFQNRWHNDSKQWGQEQAIITRQSTQTGTSRYIRKLGNPVVTRGPDNALWLFYVSVSIGGWAGSSINFVKSHDEGQSWSKPKRLITTPFLNISTLIKGASVTYTDGTIGLPIYHEFLGKFGVMIRLNQQAEVIHKTRLSWGKTSLQPIIFVTSADAALAMMRYHGPPPNRILSQDMTNAGLNLSKPKKTSLPNPDAGIMGLTLQDNQLLLAFNNHEEEREDMSIAISNDAGKNWKVLATIEANRLKVPDKLKQFAYPWLLQTNNGTVHLLYTWHKSHIKHVVFNQAWLPQIQSDKTPLEQKSSN